MLLQFSLPTAFVFPLFVPFFRRSRCTFRQNVYDVTKTFFPEKEINVQILPLQKWYTCIFTHEKCALWRNNFCVEKGHSLGSILPWCFENATRLMRLITAFLLCYTGKHMSTRIRFQKLYNRYTYWKETSRPHLGYFLA